jgi:carbon storage regulator CsrA
MLVLSRRQSQSFVFRTLDISVKILQIKGNTIRLGIQAPPDVTVLREELVPQAQAASRWPLNGPQGRGLNHDMRGRLNTALMALYVVEKQLRAGLTREAEETLQEALRVLQSLDHTLAASDQNPKAAPDHKAIGALLVEDDCNEEALLASYLRMSGFQIETVHDGYEALEFLASHDRPDFVLLDMRLPRCDGPSTVSAIRQDPAYNDVRIFAVTGSSPEEIPLAVGPGGVDGWFRKPLNPARIVEAMNAAAWTN